MSLQSLDDPGSAPAIAPEADELVLSTLNKDGSRRWLRPRVSPGRFLNARRVVGYLLIAIFTLLPHIRIGGKPAIFLDIAHREFTFFGKTLLATDTILLALFIVTTFVSIFLVTALLGRVWCGWGCPQTVYMELVYRPIERLFDGSPGRGGAPGKKRTVPRTILKYAVYVAISAFLAHTFLAYFVGTEALAQWVLESPTKHWGGFLVVLLTTALMTFDFAYFREQLCIVACPYGRFQSVMLDRDSLIISYDARRGEPRGRGRARAGGDSERGDCVDCGLCVDTCPTGIDIRDGLKMECIACAQCIDACDRVMTKIKRPRGLIRYSSQARMAGERARVLRPRVILYPLLLVAFGTLFSLALAAKQHASVTLLPRQGLPFTRGGEGEVINRARIKIQNREKTPREFLVELVAEFPVRLVGLDRPVSVGAGRRETVPLTITAPAAAFRGGARPVTIVVTSGDEYRTELPYRLHGPAGGE